MTKRLWTFIGFIFTVILIQGIFIENFYLGFIIVAREMILVLFPMTPKKIRYRYGFHIARPIASNNNVRLYILIGCAIVCWFYAIFIHGFGAPGSDNLVRDAGKITTKVDSGILHELNLLWNSEDEVMAEKNAAIQAAEKRRDSLAERTDSYAWWAPWTWSMFSSIPTNTNTEPKSWYPWKLAITYTLLALLYLPIAYSDEFMNFIRGLIHEIESRKSSIGATIPSPVKTGAEKAKNRLEGWGAVVVADFMIKILNWVGSFVMRLAHI
jgi:hypothetical protein